MEPHTATVHLADGKAVVVASTQTPFRAQEEAAKAMGLAVGDVRVRTPFVGGGFGGKTRNQQIVEAARLCKHLNRSVQVAWTREEEFFYDSFRPAAVVKIRSGVDGQGRIQHWDYEVYFAGDRGSAQFYDIPNHRTVFRGDLQPSKGETSPHPFAVGYWRAPGNNTNTFARECQMDMLAEAAKMDPLAFRKMRHVLQAASAQFGWEKAPAAPSRTGRSLGRGIACGIDAGTYVAAMAEVEVDESTGAIAVKRVVVAQNMGLCINPEGAATQIEGCVTMGMGYALTEEVHFRGGEILDTNFDTYDIPRFSWLPKIEHVIVHAPQYPSQGGGEPPIIVMGAVLANAVYDACGARLFQLPMTPARVEKALELVKK